MLNNLIVLTFLINILIQHSKVVPHNLSHTIVIPLVKRHLNKHVRMFTLRSWCLKLNDCYTLGLRMFT